ncbi:MAG: restriction endonuclease [Agriterribacter sp.]
MKIYLSTNYSTDNPVREALELISDKLRIQIFQADYFNIEEQIVPQLIETIKKSDVIVADISNENPNIYYEVGIAHSLGKPVILVSQTNNFNRFSLLSYRFYNYDINSQGIKNLSFRLEQILTDASELDKLKPLIKRKDILDFQDSTNTNKVDEILNLTGVAKFYELEKWVYSLLKEIPGFEVQYNERRSGKEYDFIVWNANQSEELLGLGNPIPIEVKASNYVENNLIHSLISKASSQGFKSFILITAANLTEGNKKLIRDLKAHSGIAILVIDREDLRQVYSSKDLLKSFIKSFRKFFIY